MKTLNTITESFFKNTNSGLEGKKNDIRKQIFDDLVNSNYRETNSNVRIEVSNDLESIDIIGDVIIDMGTNEIRKSFLTKYPIKINKVQGNCTIKLCRGYKEWGNLPDEVTGDLKLSSGGALTSLKGIPKAGGNMSIFVPNGVKTLEGLPKETNGDLTIEYGDGCSLKDFKGCSKRVNGSFKVKAAYRGYLILNTLEGIPEYIKDKCYIGAVRINSTKGIGNTEIGGVWQIVVRQFSSEKDILNCGDHNMWFGEVPKKVGKNININAAYNSRDEEEFMINKIKAECKGYKKLQIH